MMAVLLISSYIVCIHICTAAFIVHISVTDNEWTPQRNSGEIP